MVVLRVWFGLVSRCHASVLCSYNLYIAVVEEYVPSPRKRDTQRCTTDPTWGGCSSLEHINNRGCGTKLALYAP